MKNKKYTLILALILACISITIHAQNDNCCCEEEEPGAQDCGYCGMLCGCTDSLAINFNPIAITEDSTCIYGTNNCLEAACAPQSTIVCIEDGPVEFPVLEPPLTSCSLTSEYDGLIHEYLILSYPENVILGTVQTNSFDPATYTGCLTIIPIRFDIQMIKNLVHALNDTTTCQGDSVVAVYSDSAQVANMNNVIEIFSLIAGIDNLTLEAFVAELEKINDDIYCYALRCPGMDLINYCVDENIGVDCAANLYQSCDCSQPMVSADVYSRNSSVLNNNQYKKNTRMSLEVKPSGEKGFGIFYLHYDTPKAAIASVDISDPYGTIIYTGEVLVPGGKFTKQVKLKLTASGRYNVDGKVVFF